MPRGKKATAPVEQPAEEVVEKAQVEVPEVKVEEPVVEQPVEQPAVEEKPVVVETPVKDKKVESKKEKAFESLAEKEVFVEKVGYSDWYAVRAKQRGRVVNLSSLGFISRIRYKRDAAINYAKNLNKQRGFGDDLLIVE